MKIIGFILVVLGMALIIYGSVPFEEQDVLGVPRVLLVMLGSVLAGGLLGGFLVRVCNKSKSKEEKEGNVRMKVRLVKRDGRKAADFFEKNKGTIFEVIEEHPLGYDVDLAPLGHPGERGWMYRGEVEVIC